VSPLRTALVRPAQANACRGEPVGVAVTFALNEVDGDQQLQTRHVLIEFVTLRSGDYGISVIDKYRTNLTSTGRLDFPGKFGQ